MYLKYDITVQQEVKKSRFICLLARVKTQEDLKALIAKAKKEYPQATHYCSAMKSGSLSHSSDDGEPAGTAGRPMLDVLLNHEADQLGAVVVRYFGGTLLGKGGLVRAYSSSVDLAVQEACFFEPRTLGFYQLEADYSISGKVEAFLRTREVEQIQVDYGQNAVFTFMSPNDLNDELASRFSGQVQAILLKECVLENGD
ncbi:IMPACT family protein [Allobaculum stercoricanis]|uniref:IMPACT family protein n=1 Tax=Allobaculum stercoricanis TaxID=174709 RepID=UPI00248F08C3|nr:YigZ family protein [Allobaculum stercoricanis]